MKTVLAAGLLLSLGPTTSGAAKIALVNGTIHTLEGGQASTVQAIAIEDGAVVHSGSSESILDLTDASTLVIDLDGRFVIPGLVDAHAHLRGLGRAQSRVDLRGTKSIQECVDRAQAMASTLPPGAWLLGRGWDQNDWDDSTYPTRAALDAVFGERPVLLERVDGHASWVNSAAIALAGIDATTPDPAGGEIMRDPRSGEVTGIFVDNAEGLINAVLPKPSREEIEHHYRSAIATCVELGLTGVHDMGVTLEELDILREGEREGWLDLRVVVYLAGDEALAAYEGGRAGLDPASRVRVEGVKLYADGALGSRGAALLEDYSDRSGHRGLLIQSPNSLQAMIERGFDREMSIAIHAIGDRGNRVTIDAIVAAHAAVRARNPDLGDLASLRPRVEHAQVVHPDDLPRFAALGILPSMQPTHCTSDMPWAPDRLGDERIQGAYAWRTLRDSGCIIPMGSDFPVEKPSPWLGLFAARSRQTPQHLPPGGWAPAQRMSALEALLGFTSWAAEAIEAERWGDLAVGSRADLIVVDHDPLGAVDGLLDMKVMMTMVDGEVVHRSPQWPN